MDAIASLLAGPAAAVPHATDTAADSVQVGALFASVLAAAESDASRGGPGTAAVLASPLAMLENHGGPLSGPLSGPDCTLPAPEAAMPPPDTLSPLVEAPGDDPRQARADSAAPQAPVPTPMARTRTEIGPPEPSAAAIDRALMQWIDMLPTMPIAETGAGRAVDREETSDDDATDADVDATAFEAARAPMPLIAAPTAVAPVAIGAARQPIGERDDRGEVAAAVRGPSNQRERDSVPSSTLAPASAPRPASPRAETAPPDAAPTVARGGGPAASQQPSDSVASSMPSPPPRPTAENSLPTPLPTAPGPVASTQTLNATVAAVTAPTFQAQLSTAIDSPAFGAALGVQISTLVHNGIAEARLQLNPAEFGPIAVQIGLDGSQAQVQLTVEHAHTRQTLEQALPELAQALRDAGFTMTGGGVSQQPRERAPGAQPDADDGPARGEAGELAAVASSAAPRLLGMVDLYA